MGSILVTTPNQNNSDLNHKIAKNIMALLKQFQSGEEILNDALSKGDILINFTNTYHRKPEEGFSANWDCTERTINIWFDADPILLTQTIGASQPFPLEIFKSILFELCNAANLSAALGFSAKDFENSELFARAKELVEFDSYRRFVTANNDADRFFGLRYYPLQNYQKNEFEKYWLELANREDPSYGTQKNHANRYRLEWNEVYELVNESCEGCLKLILEQPDFVEINKCAVIEMIEENLRDFTSSPIFSNMPSGQALIHQFNRLKSTGIPSITPTIERANTSPAQIDVKPTNIVSEKAEVIELRSTIDSCNEDIVITLKKILESDRITDDVIKNTLEMNESLQGVIEIYNVFVENDEAFETLRPLVSVMQENIRLINELCSPQSPKYSLK